MKTMASLLALAGVCFAGFALLPACSSSTDSAKGGNGGGGNSVQGSVAGVTFKTVSGHGFTSTFNGVTDVAVDLTNREDVNCATSSSLRYASLDLLDLSFGALETGTYAFDDPLSTDAGVVVGQGQTALGTLYVTDPQCGQVMEIYATSGTLTVSSISSAAMEGTYTVTFGDHGTFTGSFDVVICPPPDAGDPGNGMLTCVH